MLNYTVDCFLSSINFGLTTWSFIHDITLGVKMNERELFITIESIHQTYTSFLEDRLKRLGLTGLGSSHCFILETLIKSGGKLNMSEISANINRSKSTCTQLITKLERLKLVVREKSVLDKRCAHVTLTEKAKAHCGDFKDVHKTIENLVGKTLTAKEQVQFITLLDKLDYHLRQQIS